MIDIDGNGRYDVNDFLKMNNEEILKENNGKKFDIILSNPPFNLGVKFFQKYFEIADKIITIQPTKWLLTNKQNKNLTNKIDKQYCEIETVNGNEYFDAGLFADVSINYVDSQKTHKLFFNGKEYNRCEEITQFSTDSLLEEFSKKVNTDDSIWDHIKGTTSYYKGYEEHPNKDWWIVRLSEIRGHVAAKGNKESYDFYTIISNNNEFMKNNIGQYKDIKKIPTRQGKYEFGYFAFETEQELNNFIRYIKTDFVRGCLKLSKNHSNQFRGCFKTIPWFDFSNNHFSKSPKEIDDWLFKKYNISDEIRKHIEEILPDYYNIINIDDIDGNGRYDVNDFLKMNNEEILKENNGKKFDICLMNPPYSKDRFGDGLYIDFLNKCLDISDKVISVNPLNMLISHGVGGALKNKTNKIVKYINECKPKIEVIDKSLFDAGIKGDLCIISFNGNNENIIINKDSKTYKFKEHKDINFTSDYVKIFKSKLFKYMIGEDINDYIHLKFPKIYTENKEIKIKHDNLYNHLKFNGGEPYAKMNAILDKNPNKDSLFIYIYKINASFGGILYKSLTYNNAVEYNESIFAKGSLLYIELNKNDYKKSKNICSYLKTDFCKLITNLAGEYFHPYLRYDFIPWLDFSKEWTDEELFEMIGMKYDKEEIDKIIKK